MAIGPEYRYPYGKKLMQGDRGGIFVGFTVLKKERMAAWVFGTDCSFFCDPPDTIRNFSRVIRDRVIAAFGALPYDASTLPLRVVANHTTHMVEIHLPATTPVIIANPEMWLALAERIDEEADKLAPPVKDRANQDQ